ncbi:DUF4148 domain-containing protein [Acidovorax sp. JHL-9]|uniref:DUF4148 domain-containing protein n=1 Tax=Acidovorax sp. JHL-9 TaxID=1276756 RepID=UPI000418ABE2|nr:DUF4148 domain-containing protein [Acidovorax sp. JHL-9]
MNAHPTLPIAAALAVGALAAQADSALPGDSEWSNYPLTTTSTLTRETVIAELVAARKAGTMPSDREWYNIPAPLGTPPGPVQAGAMPAATTNSVVTGNQ